MVDAPTGDLPAASLASLTSVIIAATVGAAPDVPLDRENTPSSTDTKLFLASQVSQIYIHHIFGRLTR
jgi:hypothetical protein